MWQETEIIANIKKSNENYLVELKETYRYWRNLFYHKFLFTSSRLTIIQYVTFAGNLDFLICLQNYFQLHTPKIFKNIMTMAVQQDHIHIIKYCSKKTSAIIEFIPLYDIKSVKSLDLLIEHDVIDFKTLFKNQCQHKFELFRQLCKKMPATFWNQYVDEIKCLVLILKNNLDYNHFPVIKKYVDDLLILPDPFIQKNPLVKANICYFFISRMVSTHCPVKSLCEIILDFISFKKFISKPNSLTN